MRCSLLQAIVSDEALGKRGIVKVLLPAILLNKDDYLLADPEASHVWDRTHAPLKCQVPLRRLLLVVCTYNIKQESFQCESAKPPTSRSKDGCITRRSLAVTQIHSSTGWRSPGKVWHGSAQLSRGRRVICLAKESAFSKNWRSGCAYGEVIKN
jgi:hypothetical protein